MNRSLTALFAALESLLVVGIGLGLLLVPFTALWAFQYDLQIDWVLFYRAAADGWLLGHGVDLRVALPSLTGTVEPFVVTIGALGIALLTALLGVRAGRRLRGTDHPAVALLSAAGSFGILAALVTLTAGAPEAQPSRWQGVLLPTVVFLVGIGLGVVISGPEDRRRPVSRNPGAVLRARDRVLDLFPPRLVTAAAWSLRLAGITTAALLAVSAIVVTVLLALGYATVISLYESLQAGPLGGLVLTVGQLALLPNLVVWAAAWLVGPGFAIGAGSQVSPLGTALGPLPSLPVFGALPTGELPFGLAGVAVPIALAFIAGAVLASRVAADLGGSAQVRDTLFTAAASGVLGGLMMAALCAAASGAAGAGRLAVVGPDPWVVGGIAALELVVGCTLGALTGLRVPSRGAAD